MLDRPLIVLDCETTGVDPFTDRIVQLAILRFEQNATGPKRKKSKTFVRLFNPGQPIPKEASEVHNITDEDVANCGPFSEIAAWLRDQLIECDIAGYNCKRFDLPLILCEMRRAGIELDLSENRILDAYEVFVQMKPRTLEAALWEYCRIEHTDAHDAMADVIATAHVLDSQIDYHEDLPPQVEEIDALFRKPDLAGRLEYRDDQLCFAFGKHKGQPLRQVARHDEGYLNWILRSDFLPDVKAAVRQSFIDAYGGAAADEDEDTDE